MIPYATSGQLKALDEKVDGVDERISREKIGYDYKVTYIELFKKMLNSQLQVGKRYRITDYNLALADDLAEDHKSANHPFDVIVTAETPASISEIAYAAECNDYDPYWHYREEEGEVFLNECDLSRWVLRYRMFVRYNTATYEYRIPFTIKVKYVDESGEEAISTAPFYEIWNHDYTEEKGWERTLECDDDDNTLYWIMECKEPKVGDTVYDSYDLLNTGIITEIIWDEDARGGITGMIDEHNLRCSYDFKNMLVKGSTVVPSFTSRADRWYCTFSCSDNVNLCDVDNSVISTYADLHDIHIDGYDVAICGNSCDSYIGAETDKVFFAGGMHNSHIGEKCSEIVCNQFYNCTIGDYCERVRCGTSFIDNWQNLVVKSRCVDIAIHTDLNSNNSFVTIGGNCTNITLISVKGPITLGNQCKNITFAAKSQNSTNYKGYQDITFEDLCENITLGQSSIVSSYLDMKFGKACKSITITPDVAAVTVKGIAFGQNCESITLTGYIENLWFDNRCNHITVGGQLTYSTFGEGCGYITLPKSDERGTLYQSLIFGDKCQCITSTFVATGTACDNTIISNIVFETSTGYGWATTTPIDIKDQWLQDEAQSDSTKQLHFYTDYDKNAIMYKDIKFTRTGKYKAVNSTGDWTNI